MRGKRFVLREEVGLLEGPPEPPPSVAFLPPFDPLVWDRGLLGSLFGFDYVWELFLPPAKRRWGWYVLPMLFGDRLVGRIEPRIDRAGGQVQVIGLWWEDGFAPRRTEGFVDAMRDALRAYLRFRRRDPARVGTAPRNGETTVSHAPLERLVDRAPRCLWQNGLAQRSIPCGSTPVASRNSPAAPVLANSSAGSSSTTRSSQRDEPRLRDRVLERAARLRDQGREVIEAPFEPRLSSLRRFHRFGRGTCLRAQRAVELRN